MQLPAGRSARVMKQSCEAALLWLLWPLARAEVSDSSTWRLNGKSPQSKRGKGREDGLDPPDMSPSTGIGLEHSCESESESQDQDKSSTSPRALAWMPEPREINTIKHSFPVLALKASMSSLSLLARSFSALQTGTGSATH